ncbi:hypothetical protein KKC13_01080 [bacterium]|nr:hypothetical protein [bacterium]MBU1957772.1 hypothetical protein [bacterium]
MKQLKQVIVGILFLGMIFSSSLYSTDVNDNVDCNVTGTILCDTGGDTGITPPITDDKLNPSIKNNLGAVNILNLSGRDAEGMAVNNFTIKTLPDATQGILYREDGITAVVVEENLTKEESDGLRFDPDENYVGDATFTYVAVDDFGLIGNEATVTIPVIASDLIAPVIPPVLTPALPPVDTNQSEGCVCEDYTETIPIFTTMGLMIMVVLTLVMGSIFLNKELEI